MDWLSHSIMRQPGVAQGRAPDTHALIRERQLLRNSDFPNEL